MCSSFATETFLFLSLREREEVAPDKIWDIGHEAAKLASTFFLVVCSSSSNYFYAIWYFSKRWFLVLYTR
ncbi:hypothetical protein PVAP13_5KG647500 [Panicum virgatum]|uniref:Uncharacterized protein n=1 Tax=Panicum virgatum TaxID=38727 RepID=A0A8T0SYG0_PANVG|nr:hypothetical protein PVAP13_5KG647500 [Panicum virgatum]